MAATLTEIFCLGRREFVVTLGYAPAALRLGFDERRGGAINWANDDDDGRNQQ